jgi:hypothetical protein
MFKDLMRVDHDASAINRTDARVRAFLSQTEALDALLQPARVKPLCLAKYNFPSLLRAVTHLHVFGNIRDLHEGGIEGEAMVKVPRPLLPNGLKDQFAQQLLRKAFRDTTADRLLLNLGDRDEGTSTRYSEDVPTQNGRVAFLGNNAVRDENDDSDADTLTSVASDDSDDELEPATLDFNTDPFENMRHVLNEEEDDAAEDRGGGEVEFVPSNASEPSPLLFRRHSTLATVESYFTMGMPVSVVLTNQKGPQRMGVVVATCNEWWLLPLRIEQVQHEDDLGFTYFQISLHPNKDQMLVRTKNDGENPTHHIQLLNCATLLPALWSDAPFPHALATMEGDHLDAEHNFV